MYLVNKYEKNDSMLQQMAQMFGITIPDKATRCEVWGTTFNERGDDYCEFRFFNNDFPLTAFRVAGY